MDFVANAAVAVHVRWGERLDHYSALARALGYCGQLRHRAVLVSPRFTLAEQLDSLQRLARGGKGTREIISFLEAHWDEFSFENQIEVLAALGGSKQSKLCFGVFGPFYQRLSRKIRDAWSDMSAQVKSESLQALTHSGEWRLQCFASELNKKESDPCLKNRLLFNRLPLVHSVRKDRPTSPMPETISEYRRHIVDMSGDEKAKFAAQLVASFDTDKILYLLLYNEVALPIEEAVVLSYVDRAIEEEDACAQDLIDVLLGRREGIRFACYAARIFQYLIDRQAFALHAKLADLLAVEGCSILEMADRE